jgi:hypothetical protein
MSSNDVSDCGFTVCALAKDDLDLMVSAVINQTLITFNF